MQDCTSWNKSRMFCKRCKTAYNRQLEQNAKNSVLKQWWPILEPHEKVAWFKKQKMLNPNKYGRRKYDADKMVASDFKEKKRDQGDMDDFVTMSQFVKEEVAGGMSRPAAMKYWKQCLLDPNIEKLDHPQHGRLLHVFRGVRRYTGESEGFRTELNLEKNIADSAIMFYLPINNFHLSSFLFYRRNSNKKDRRKSIRNGHR